MIVGIGCDIVGHNTTKILGWESDVNILKRVLCKEEIALFNTNKELKFIAGRFAAKEAVLKCLGTGMYDGISLSDIRILQLEDGKPSLDLAGEPQLLSQKMGINSWHISITHSMDFSLAFAVAEIN